MFRTCASDCIPFDCSTFVRKGKKLSPQAPAARAGGDCVTHSQVTSLHRAVGGHYEYEVLCVASHRLCVSCRGSGGWISDGKRDWKHYGSFCGGQVREKDLMFLHSA